MLRRLTSVLLTAALALSATAAAVAAPPPVEAVGVWRNPHDSVHIALKPCGSEICGFVVWASPKAEAAARKGGTPKLVGEQLMRGFVVGPDGVARGKVFVPDVNATFAGSAQMVDARTLKAKGCLFANVFCKTQVWVRIDNAPA